MRDGDRLIADPSRVIIDQLPLQAILHFQPPSRAEAVSYLESISYQMGIDDGRYASHLYERCTVRQPDLLDQPLPPNGHEWLPYFDLRRAIMQMQLERGEAVEDAHKAVLGTSDAADLREVGRALEVKSFADAWIVANSATRVEVRLFPQKTMELLYPVLILDLRDRQVRAYQR